MARKTTQTEQAAESKGPAFIAYTVTNKGEKEDKSFWRRIGAAWKHKDGEGLNIELEALPLDGRIVLRVPRADDETTD